LSAAKSCAKSRENRLFSAHILRKAINRQSSWAFCASGQLVGGSLRFAMLPSLYKLDATWQGPIGLHTLFHVQRGHLLLTHRQAAPRNQ
jgi:hypothetical protein